MLSRSPSFEDAGSYSILASGSLGGGKRRSQASLTAVECHVYWSRLGWPEAHRGRAAAPMRGLTRPAISTVPLGLTRVLGGVAARRTQGIRKEEMVRCILGSLASGASANTCSPPP